MMIQSIITIISQHPTDVRFGHISSLIYVLHPHYMQLGWLAIAEWAYAGIFAVTVQFQNQDKFWIPHQKLQWGRFLMFP